MVYHFSFTHCIAGLKTTWQRENGRRGDLHRGLQLHLGVKPNIPNILTRGLDAELLRGLSNDWVGNAEAIIEVLCSDFQVGIARSRSVASML